MPTSTPISTPASIPADQAVTIAAPMIAGATLSGDGSACEDQMVVTRHRLHPQTELVRVFGEVDLCTAPPLREVLDDTWRRVAPAHPADPADNEARGRQVVCDLTGVEFLSAAGLAALAAADQAARFHGLQLRVVTGSRMVRRVLAVHGLDRDLDSSWRLGDLEGVEGLGGVGDVVAPTPSPRAA